MVPREPGDIKVNFATTKEESSLEIREIQPVTSLHVILSV